MVVTYDSHTTCEQRRVRAWESVQSVGGANPRANQPYGKSSCRAFGASAVERSDQRLGAKREDAVALRAQFFDSGHS